MTKRTQEQFLQEILELKRANPDYDIHFCIDSDEMLEDGWTSHEIKSNDEFRRSEPQARDRLERFVMNFI